MTSDAIVASPQPGDVVSQALRAALALRLASPPAQAPAVGPSDAHAA